MATIYKQGSKGFVVEQIQKIVGAYPDGIWGAVTTECVKRWQLEHDLTPDGLAGPATLAKMGISTTAQAVTPQPATRTISRDGVTLKTSKRRIDYIVIHCTATREGMPMTVEDIRNEHLRNGWSDIGYHYVVTLDGKIHLGRDVDKAGAHVSGYNSNSIGIAYVGGVENVKGVPYSQLKAKDTRTPAQKKALLTLLTDLRKLYPYAKIRGHRDFSPDKNHNGTIEPSEWIKQCPSFDAATEYRII